MFEIKRKITYKGNLFDYAAADKHGQYDLLNKADELCDIFEDECRTGEERAKGYFWGDWHVFESPIGSAEDWASFTAELFKAASAAFGWKDLDEAEAFLEASNVTGGYIMADNADVEKRCSTYIDRALSPVLHLISEREEPIFADAENVRAFNSGVIVPGKVKAFRFVIEEVRR